MLLLFILQYFSSDIYWYRNTTIFEKKNNTIWNMSVIVNQNRATRRLEQE